MSITEAPAQSAFDLPFEAQILPAPVPKFRERVVFVPHFGGSSRSVLRHVRLVHQLGFDAVRFNLSFNEFRWGPLPISSGLRFGAGFVWSEQIEAILNALPGPKILYSFSMPSLGALGAISHRKASDVTAWVCDGGPFSQILRCTWNLLRESYHIENRLQRATYSALAYTLFGGVELAAPGWLHALPARFPTLSIRGALDPLVPTSAIDQVFAHAPQIDLEQLVIPQGRHLDGLKKFPDLYEPQVRAFLSRAGTAMSSGPR